MAIKARISKLGDSTGEVELFWEFDIFINNNFNINESINNVNNLENNYFNI